MGQLVFDADTARAIERMYEIRDAQRRRVSLHSQEPKRMHRVVRAFDEHLAHPSLPRTLASWLRSAGFVDVAMQAHAFASCEMDPETYGVSVLPGIRSFVPGHDGISEEEAKGWFAEQRELGERGEFFMSVTQFCFEATKG